MRLGSFSFALDLTICAYPFRIPPHPTAIVKKVNEIEHVLEHDDKKKKNMRLLWLVSSTVRALDGARVVCCKSAKDRTSMSITWEQACLLREHHGLPADSVASVSDVMRLRGVRRGNVLKNTGKPYYAFNALQRTMLPPELCPSPRCCGKVVS